MFDLKGATMYKCSNCEREYEAPALAVQIKGQPVANICDACLDNVLTLKVVLKRDGPAKPLAFEQYLPVESAKF